MTGILHPLYFDLVPQEGTVTARAHGIDISKYDQFFQPETATAQLDFVIQRVSYGVKRDESFDVLLPGVKRVGVRGAYHYLSSWVDFRTQADAFLEYISGVDYHFLVCDFEESYNTLSLSFAKLAWDWIHYVQGKADKPVLLYTSPSLYNQYIYPSQKPYGIDWNTVELWLAQWFFIPNPDGAPTTPTGRTRPWKFWQYTPKGDGTKYGVARPTACDLNVYNGTAADLRQWLSITETIPPQEGGTVNGTATEKLGKTVTARSEPVVASGNAVGLVAPYAKVEFSEIVQDLGNPAWKWLKLADGKYVNYLYPNSLGQVTQRFTILTQPTTDTPPAGGIPVTIENTVVLKDEAGDVLGTWKGTLTKQ